MMHTKAVSLLAAVTLALGSGAVAGPKTYQITGPVVAMDDASITIKAKKEKWQFSRDPNSAASEHVKIGDSVTVTYWMTSAKVELKEKKSSPSKPEATPDSTPKERSHE
jgi:hypothetical protein